jgi:hypothetical protein
MENIFTMIHDDLQEYQMYVGQVKEELNHLEELLTTEEQQEPDAKEED